MESLSSVQITYFKELFEAIHKEGEMCITLKDLSIVSRAVGTNPTDMELQEMMNMADTDGNGSIDFAEFTAVLVRKMCDTNQLDELRDAFNIFDRQNNGYISPSDLGAVYLSLGLSLSEENLEDMIREVDTDLDGVLGLDEFCNMMVG